MKKPAVRAVLLAGALALGPGGAARAAEPEYAPQVIVKWAPGASQAVQSTLERAAGVLGQVGTVTVNGAEVLRVAGDAKAAAALLDRSGAVLYAEPDIVLRALAIPNDPLFGQLYGIHNANDKDLDGPEGWDLAGLAAFPSTGGVEVGIVDTGIDASHPDLAGKRGDCAAVAQGLLGIIGGSTTPSTSRGCADDNDHGTHVSGTITGNANNGIGVAGVAFNSQVSHCKALFGPAGTGSTSGVANCITWLRQNGARVISMSLGGGASSTLQSAVSSAYGNGNGALLVAAAGNDGNSAVNYPAGYAEVVSVAATDSNDNKASFSNTNPDVELAAAGVSVLSTARSNTYKSFSGTSMATPHVAGAAAVVMGRLGLSAGATRTRLTSTADDIGAPGRDTSFGFGRVNLANALR